MRRLIAIAVAAALSVLAVAVPAQAAPAPAGAEIFWTSLIARGAAVDVAFGATCPEGSTGTVEVAVTQVRDDGLTARGSQTAVLTCGVPDTQRVLADITGAPFTRGPATLTMLLSGCDDTGCFTLPITRTVRLRP